MNINEVCVEAQAAIALMNVMNGVTETWMNVLVWTDARTVKFVELFRSMIYECLWRIKSVSCVCVIGFCVMCDYLLIIIIVIIYFPRKQCEKCSELDSEAGQKVAVKLPIAKTKPKLSGETSV